MEQEKINLDFSVIVCCYNPDLDKLKKTLISILNQRGVSFEIIVSDDGSIENYEEELMNWFKSIDVSAPYKMNFLSQNVGTVKNILSALEISQGRYIKAISPGDYLYDKNTLKVYLDHFVSEQADLLYADTIFYNETGIVEKKNVSHYKRIYDKNHIKNIFGYSIGYFMGVTIACPIQIIRNALKLVENKVIYMEDRTIMFYALLENNKVYGIKKPLVWYEYGTGISTKTKRSPLLEKDMNELFKHLEERYKNDKIVQKFVLKHRLSQVNYFKKCFIYLFRFPRFFFEKIMLHLMGRLHNKTCIEQKEEIIQF